MKSKSFVLMFVSLGFGLVAAIGISQVMGSKGSSAPAIPKRPVLVAAVDLEHNSLLNEENVRVEEWPVEIIPENTAGSIEEINEMLTQQALAKGMPINLSSIVHKSKGNTIVIPEGFTVYSIKVSGEDTVYGMLQPGDKVNMIGYIKGKPVKTFLRAMRVFSVNSQMKSDATSREEKGTGGEAVVGILVNEKQSELIMHVQKEGNIKLVLRGDSVQAEEENAMDEEGIAALGILQNLDQMSVQPTQTTTQTTPVPQTSFNQPKQNKTMKIWSKEGMEMVTFKDGVAVGLAPIDRDRRRSRLESEGNQENERESAESPSKSRRKSSEDSELKLDDAEDSEDYNDFERGLDEDKY